MGDASPTGHTGALASAADVAAAELAAADEPARLRALRALEVLDTPAEEEFDVIVRLAAQICATPIALVSLVDEHRQWFKARVGFEASEAPRDISFCTHAIRGRDLMEVPDTSSDPRFRNNPLRTGATNVQFYAGVPLTTASGHKLGTLCVIDRTPRSLTSQQREGLQALAGQIMRLFELRRSARLHRETAAALQAADDDLRVGQASRSAAPAQSANLQSVALLVLIGILSVAAVVWPHPWSVVLLGLFATCLTAALLWSLRRTRTRAYLLASRMTGALRRSERTLRDVVDGTSDFILATDQRGKLVFTNLALREALSLTEVEATGMTLRDIIHPSSWHDTQRLFDAIQKGQGPPARMETTFTTRSGPRLEVEGTISVIRAHESTTLRAIFRDVTARKAAQAALLAANAELARFAALDGLTGTANRRAFDARLTEEWSRARRHNTPLTLVMLDVDYFKSFNDLYGHPTGDQCLRSVGACLRASVRRAGELAARYGGEEFALLLPGVTEDDGRQIAERLRESLEHLGIAHDRSPLGRVTASLGVASVGAARIDSAESLLLAADRALYRAKHGGRNRVVCAE